MGNAVSQHVFLQKEPDWEAYAQAEWRSERARELDKFGSIARHPVPRGESMTAKLLFLQKSIKEQRNEIAANVETKRDKEMSLEQGGPRKEISQKKFGGGFLHSMSLARAASGRPRNVDIPSLSTEASLHRKATLETFVPESVHQPLVGDGVSNYGYHGVERIAAPTRAVAHAAEWRTRVHAARRRVLLIVLAYVRWSSVLRRKRRMPRVNSFSYYIPTIFDEDLKRFLAEHKKYSKLLAEEGGGGKGLKFKDVEVSEDHVSEEESEEEGLPKRSSKPLLRTSKTMNRSQGTMGGTFKALLPSSTMTRKSSHGKATLPPLESSSQADSSGGGESERPSPGDRPSPATSSPRPPQFLHSPTFSGPAGRASYAGMTTEFTGSLAASYALANAQETQAHLTAGSTQTSRYGFKPAYLRSLAPKAVERAVKSNWQGRASESGLNLPVPGHFTSGGGASSDMQTPDANSSASPRNSNNKSSDFPSGSSFNENGDTSISSRIDSRQGSNVSSVVSFPSIMQRQTMSASENPSGPGFVNRGVVALSPLSRHDPSVSDYTASRLGVTVPESEPSEPMSHLPRVGRYSMGGSDSPTFSRPKTAGVPQLEHQTSSSTSGRRMSILQQSITGRMLSGQEDDVLMSSLTPAKLVKELRSLSVQEEEEDRDKFAEEMAEAMEQAASMTVESSDTPTTRSPLEDSASLLAMYVNRGNASWASSKSWAAPRVWTRLLQDEWKVSLENQIWRTNLTNALKGGQIAIQILAFQDPMVLPDGTQVDPWTMDPWEVIVNQNPKIPRVCIKGVPLGCRTLINLALSVEGMAGKEAVSKLTVVLHLSEQQLVKTQDQIFAFNFCGLDPGNILFITQGRRNAYKYHSINRKFSSVPTSEAKFVGSGLSMMQLNWASEAKRMDATGESTTMIETVLEDLEAKNVNWLLSYNSCDLSLLTRESFIDQLCLPFTMSLQRTGSANCSLQVIKSESLAFLNKQFSPAHPAAIGSVVLGQKGKEGLGSFLQPVAELGPPELQAGNMKDNLRLAKGGGNHYCVGFGRYALHMSLLKNLLVSPNVFRPKLLLRKDLLYVHMDAGDMLAAEGAKAVCLQARNDVKQLLSHEDLSDLIPLLEAQDALNAFRRLATQRSLAASTSEHNTSRSARVKRNSSNQLGNQENSLNRISDEGRLSQSRRPRNAASQDGQYDSLISPKGVLSDASLSNNEEPALDPPDSSVKRGTLNSLTCIVFVTGSSISNAAVDAALQLVKSGRDSIHLVTVISPGGGQSRIDASRAMLNQYLPQISRAMVNYELEVLTTTMETQQHGLLDTMEDYIQKVGAGLVVMGSKALSSQMLQSSAVLGSVTLAAVKRIKCPILVINSNSAGTIASCKDGAMKAMVVCQRNMSMNEIVTFLCNNLQPNRGDSILVGQVTMASAINSSAGFDAVRSQRMMAETRLVNGLAQMAVLKGFTPQPVVQVETETLPDVLDILKRESVHLFGYLLPQNNAQVPEIVVHLLHTSKSAVLIYRNQSESNRR